MIAALGLLLTTGFATAADRTFGEELTPELETTAIADILADPEAWEGKRVRIEGDLVLGLKLSTIMEGFFRDHPWEESPRGEGATGGGSESWTG